MRKKRFAAMAALFTLSALTACGSVESIQEDSGSPDSAVSLPDSSVDAPAECVTECVSENDLRDCDSGGLAVTCPLGCDATGEPRCREIVPSNGLDLSHVFDVSGGLVVEEGATATINTDSGEITGISPGRAPGTGVGNGIRFQFLDNGLTAFGVQGMDIQGTLMVRGSRPLVILSAGEARVSGTINVSAGASGGYGGADRWRGGAGGGNGARYGAPATGCAPGANGIDADGNGTYSGGGGGGLGDDGAAGGASSNVDEPGGVGGDIAGCPGATLVPLQGGSGGGFPESSSTSYKGGGGGGAVQITSYSQISIAGGTIAAVGAGGIYRGGGGSGGGILLEAPAISLSHATLAANGGAGGGYLSSYTGADGRLDEQPAPGSGGGGNGGSLLASAQPGTTYSYSGGGGGAAVGIIRLNVPYTHLSMSDSLASPAETRGDPVAE